MKKLLLISLALLFPLSFLSAHGGIDDDELIIRLNSAGFEPRELTVVESDEVLFINNDDMSRTLSSDFDTDQTIKAGESYKFRFGETGRWHFNDTQNKKISGLIIVLEDPALPHPNMWQKLAGFVKALWHKLTAKKVATIDTALANKFRDLSAVDQYKWLDQEAESEGAETAWAYIKAAYNTPQGVIGNPHDLAHYAGKLIFKSYGFEGLAHCTMDFAFGCYHGLMEAAFDPEQPEKFPRALVEAELGCQSNVATSSPAYWSCIHGIGHGVATFRQYVLEPALTDCDSLGAAISTYCNDGVFMEFSRNAAKDFYKRANPLYPCENIPAKYRTSCGRNQVQVMKQKFNFSNLEVAAACLKSSDKEIKYHCIDAIGYAVGQANAQKTDRIVLECGAIPDKAAAAQCTAAAAGELVFQNTAGWQEAVVAVCGTSDICWDRVNNVKESYGRK